MKTNPAPTPELSTLQAMVLPMCEAALKSTTPSDYAIATRTVAKVLSEMARSVRLFSRAYTQDGQARMVRAIEVDGVLLGSHGGVGWDGIANCRAYGSSRLSFLSAPLAVNYHLSKEGRQENEVMRAVFRSVQPIVEVYELELSAASVVVRPTRPTMKP